MANGLTKRVASIDAFRGLLIILMFLVSSKSPWSQLRHAPWFGMHLSDLVYPGFLLTVGISLKISWNSQRNKNIERKKLYQKICLRCFKLFLLGNILLSLSYSTLRFNLGTLQCIALALLFSLPFVELSILKRIIVSTTICCVITLLETFVGNPDLSSQLQWQEGKTFAEYLDILILGKPKGIEGVLSTVSLVSVVIIGTIVGDLYIKRKNLIRNLLLLALTLFIIAFILIIFSIPIIPALATSSFVFFSCTISILSLVIFIIFADRLEFKKLCLPFVVYGTNAIAVYIFIRLIQLWVFDVIHLSNDLTLRQALVHYSTNYINSVVGNLIFPIFKVVIGYLFCLILYRKGICIKI